MYKGFAGLYKPIEDHYQDLAAQKYSGTCTTEPSNLKLMFCPVPIEKVRAIPLPGPEYLLDGPKDDSAKEVDEARAFLSEIILKNARESCLPLYGVLSHLKTSSGLVFSVERVSWVQIWKRASDLWDADTLPPHPTKPNERCKLRDISTIPKDELLCIHHHLTSPIEGAPPFLWKTSKVRATERDTDLSHAELKKSKKKAGVAASKPAARRQGAKSTAESEGRAKDDGVEDFEEEIKDLSSQSEDDRIPAAVKGKGKQRERSKTPPPETDDSGPDQADPTPVDPVITLHHPTFLFNMSTNPVRPDYEPAEVRYLFLCLQLF